MSAFPDARFLTSAPGIRQCPADDGAEVAFAGRSNAGKSSAINALVQRRGLARTSGTPGRTQLLNFFHLAEARRLVDLPGYGFAQAPRAVRDNWLRLLDDYFASRRSLRGLFLMLDVRRELNDSDERLLDWAVSQDRGVMLLLTKADKLRRAAATSALAAARRAVAGRADVLLFSALKGSGVDAARARLADWLDIDAPAG